LFVHCKVSWLHGSMKNTPPAHEHVVQIRADCFVQTLDGFRNSMCLVRGDVCTEVPRCLLPCHHNNANLIFLGGSVPPVH
jgi:hypothetical protein